MRAAPPIHSSTGGTRPMRYVVPLLVALVVTGVTAARAADEVGPPRPATQPASRPAGDRAAALAKWWAGLADRDPAAREAARSKLLGMDAADLPAFRQVVADTQPMLPSQAAELRDIVTQVFLQGRPYASDVRQGFLGVRLGQVNIAVRDPQPPGPPNENELRFPDTSTVYGVVILERMPGFAGARSLQDGDVVLGIVERGIQFQSPEELRAAIVFFGAGQTVHVQVLRQGRVIKVPLTLDARPADADFNPGGPPPMEKLLDDRDQAANEYWEQAFAPLLKEGVG